MTQRNLIELIDAQVPGRGEVFIRTLANLGLREFSEETAVLRGTSTITTDGSLRYAFPAGALAIRRLFDGKGTEVPHSATYQFHLLPSGQYGWWVEDGQIVIGEVVDQAGNGKTFQAVSSGETFEVHYVRAATPLASGTMDQEIDLPAHLHGAIEAYVMERMDALERRPYWFAKWKEYVRLGKKHANLAGSRANYNVLLHEL